MVGKLATTKHRLVLVMSDVARRTFRQITSVDLAVPGRPVVVDFCGRTVIAMRVLPGASLKYHGYALPMRRSIEVTLVLATLLKSIMSTNSELNPRHAIGRVRRLRADFFAPATPGVDWHPRGLRV